MTTTTKARRAKERWDRMSPNERRDVLHRDPSMRAPEWRALVEQMAHATFRELTALQREAVDHLMTGGAR